jgi:hypothetical protein
LPSKPRGAPSIDGSRREGIAGDAAALRSMPASYARRRYFARFLLLIRPILKFMSGLLAHLIPITSIQMAEPSQGCVKPEEAAVKET